MVRGGKKSSLNYDSHVLNAVLQNAPFFALKKKSNALTPNFISDI